MGSCGIGGGRWMPRGDVRARTGDGRGNDGDFVSGNAKTYTTSMGTSEGDTVGHYKQSEGSTDQRTAWMFGRPTRARCRRIAGRRHGKPRVEYRKRAAKVRRSRRTGRGNIRRAGGEPRTDAGEWKATSMANLSEEVSGDERPRSPPLGHLRIGQAKNPGPSEIPWSEFRPQDGLTYPVPHRPGFRDFYTPGYDPDEIDDVEAADMEVFKLVVETANTTSWGPLRKRLKVTKAHIMLAQETKIMVGKQAEASAWALRNGWKMVAAPATMGKNGGASGGVAIFARALGFQFMEYTYLKKAELWLLLSSRRRADLCWLFQSTSATAQE